MTAPRSFCAALPRVLVNKESTFTPQPIRIDLHDRGHLHLNRLINLLPKSQEDLQCRGVG